MLSDSRERSATKREKSKLNWEEWYLEPYQKVWIITLLRNVFFTPEHKSWSQRVKSITETAEPAGKNWLDSTSREGLGGGVGGSSMDRHLLVWAISSS